MYHVHEAEVPFAVTVKGSVARVHFFVDNFGKNYSFDLEFCDPGSTIKESDKSKKLINTVMIGKNGDFVTTGILTPVKLKVFRIDGAQVLPILDGTYNNQFLYSGGNGCWWKRIAFKGLYPGEYIANVFALNDVSGLGVYSTKFAVRWSEP